MTLLLPGSRRLAVLLAAALVLATAAGVLFWEGTPAAGLREAEALEGAQHIGRSLAGAADAPPLHDAWQRRGGQPPLAGLLQGLTWWALHGPLGTRDAAAAAGFLAGLLAVALVFLVARPRFGWLAATGGALLLLLQPGWLASLRAARPEPIAGAALLLLVAAALRADRGARPALLAALVFALAVAAHPTGLLLVLPLWLWAGLRAPAEAPEPGGRGMVPLPPFPPWVFLAPVAGLVLLVAAWPWLRDETGKRLLEYVIQGHMSQHPPFLLFGRVVVQSQEAAPPFWTGPLVWALRLTLPLLAFAALGGLRGLRAAARLRRRAGPGGRGTTTADRDLLLPTLVALTLLAVHALNGSPWYEGLDGLLVAAPIVALLAAGGLGTCLVRLREAPQPLVRRLAVPFVALAVLAAAVARLSAGAAPQTWWNALVGGPRGAARAGLQLAPEPTLPGELLEWLNAATPSRSAVTVLPDPDRYRPLLRALGQADVLRPDLFFGDLFSADHVVLTYAPELPGYAEAVAFLSDRAPLARIEHDGVPLAIVYRLGPP
jgi:hypothetical protein